MTKPRRVLVTGGSSGIGLATARRFAAAGHEVLVTGRSLERLEASGLNGAVLDVCDPAAIADFAALHGPFEIVVANAGGAQTAPILKTGSDTWDAMLALNLSSAFHLAQTVLPGMVEQGWGRFIVMGSTASIKGYRYAAAYAAAKHGALGLVRSIALELAPTGVTANLVAPGYTDTPMITAALEAVEAKTGTPAAKVRQQFANANPMGRLIDPAEVAETVLWLASDAAASVNGQVIAIDGGESA